MVVRQLAIIPSVPRPGDSRTHPTSACAVGDGFELLPEQDDKSIAVALFLVLWTA